MIIPFHKPNIPDNLDLIFPDTIRSGWLTTGLQVSRFEDSFSQYIGAKHVIALSSCTAALHLALLAKKLDNKYKFILPTLTFVSTIECGEYVGMLPILVDVEENGFLLDINQIEDIVKKDSTVKAIIPVHYGGEPVNMKHLWFLADKYGLFILEDAAHAIETVTNNKKIGNTDFAAAFSFYANKNITTGGEGGALATNDSILAEKVRKLSLHGITKDGWDRYKIEGAWEYDIIDLGYKYNLTDYAAAFGLWQLKYINQWQKRRQEIVERYRKALSRVNGILLPKIKSGHANHLFVIRLQESRWSISRNRFIKEMNNRGIGLAVHYKPIHELLYYKKRYGFKKDDFPNANLLFQSIVSLPLYPSLTDIEVDTIILNICDLYKKYAK